MTGQLGYRTTGLQDYRTTGKRDKNIVVLVYYISFKLDSGQISVLFYYMLFAGHDNCIVFYDFDFGTIKFWSLITFSNICFYIALDVFALEHLVICVNKNVTKWYCSCFHKFTALAFQRVMFISKGIHQIYILGDVLHWTQFILFTPIWCSSILCTFIFWSHFVRSRSIFKLGHFVLTIGWFEQLCQSFL